jgi:negative regulator of sigma E activity
MTPEDARAHLSAYLDGEMDSAARRELEAVLDHDPSLQAELEELRRTRELVRSLPPRRAPDGFARRVTAAIAEPGQPAASPWTRWRPAVLAAAACLVVGFLAILAVAPESKQQGRAPDAAKSPLTETAPGREREELKRAEESQRPAERAAEAVDRATTSIQDKAVEAEPAPSTPPAPERPDAAEPAARGPAPGTAEGRSEARAGRRRAPAGAAHPSFKVKKARPQPLSEAEAPHEVRSAAGGYALGEQAVKAEDLVSALAERIQRKADAETGQTAARRKTKAPKASKEQARRVHQVRYRNLRQCLERVTAALEDAGAPYAIQPQGGGQFVVEIVLPAARTQGVLARLAGKRAQEPPAHRGAAAGAAKDAEGAERAGRHVRLVIRFRRADDGSE